MARDEERRPVGETDGVDGAPAARPGGWRSAAARFNPAVPRRLLVLVAGLVWASVAVMLCRLAVVWFREAPGASALWLGCGGGVLALLVHHLGFLRIVDRNISRIRGLGERACLFGFQPLRSYMIVCIMIGMGVALRSSPIPKPYLATLYIGMGGGIGLSSVRYLRCFARGRL